MRRCPARRAVGAPTGVQWTARHATMRERSMRGRRSARRARAGRGGEDDRHMPVMPGAEPYFHPGGRTAVLLCHGFTGSPASLRPWAQYLAAAGLTVSLPRLPGHGTTWQEMARTRWEDWYAEVSRNLDELRARTDEIFVMGLSMGGCLALRLAELRDSAISGLVLVNPSITAYTAMFAFLPVVKLLVPSIKGIASDIKSENATELGYKRVPLKAAATLPGLWRITQIGRA